MKTNWSNHKYPNLSTLFIIYYWKKKIILYIIEKCNSMLSCTHHNDLQYNIVVMKASIKPWRQVWSQDSREKLKKWWSLYIELLTEFCGGPRYLFSKRVDTIIWRPSFTHHLANFLLWKILWWGIASGWPQAQSLWITKPHSLLSFLANPHLFSSLAKFLSLVCGLLKLFPWYPCFEFWLN